MDRVKIILENGSEVEVDSIFYLYNSKYCFIYTTKEIDANGYVILHLVQVGKELKNTPDGPIDTGYMVGVEISNPDEWKMIQESIMKIVEDKKNNTQNPDIQYLPISMLRTLKIVSKKTFRLMKNIVVSDFKLKIDEGQKLQNVLEIQGTNPISNMDLGLQNNNLQQSVNLSSVPLSSIGQQEILNSLEATTTESNAQHDNLVKQETEIGENVEVLSTDNISQNDVIIDYRSRFFEEQEKNQQLQLEINELKQKMESIKQVIE